MKSIFRWLLGIKESGSGVTAANRMKLMVVHDRYQMPPAIVEQMKKELLEVASKYFEIDPETAECVIKSQGNRRAFISAIVPLLKRGQANTNANSNNRKSNNKNAKAKDTRNLQASAA
ncbi:MAG: cell division topological specificity factor MinE [Candidatus Caenarcaniphilales bacterium]|jgi:cell division topological specificity factor|nr:cell division topological specificity factor MinE [Candidatus Caenarcaniphilales bacterium]